MGNQQYHTLQNNILDKNQYAKNHQWSKKQYSQNIFINNFSQDEFQLCKINQPNEIKSLISRSQYTFDHTPKVLLISSNKKQLLYLTQYCSTNIIKYLKNLEKIPVLLYQVIKKIVKTIEQLSKKYGYFGFKQTMVRVNRNQQIKVWFNNNFKSCQKQLKLSSSFINEKIVVDNIIMVFKQYLGKKLIKKPHSFNELYVLIQQQMKSSNEQILQKIRCESNYNKIFQYLNRERSQKQIKYNPQTYQKDNFTKNIHSHRSNIENINSNNHLLTYKPLNYHHNQYSQYNNNKTMNTSFGKNTFSKIKFTYVPEVNMKQQNTHRKKANINQSSPKNVRYRKMSDDTSFYFNKDKDKKPNEEQFLKLSFNNNRLNSLSIYSTFGTQNIGSEREKIKQYVPQKIIYQKMKESNSEMGASTLFKEMEQLFDQVKEDNNQEKMIEELTKQLDDMLI